MPLVNPVPAFDFRVFMIDAKPSVNAAVAVAGALASVATTLLTGSFSEASGLDAELETEEYRQGGANTGPSKFIKWGRYPNLVFRRGITLNTDIWDWYYAVLYKAADPVRKNGIVLLTDRGTGISSATGGPTPLGLPVVDRLPVAAWFFRNALPARLAGPQLNARSSEIAIETLELVHEGVYRLGPSMIPGVGAVTDALGV